MENKINDFGEKIGGARKDTWKSRGLGLDDLEIMNDREAEKFVTKDNIWKKPDYEALASSGIPVGIVYFIKKARDGLNASPQFKISDDTPEKRRARQMQYIATVKQLQETVMGVRTVEDAMGVYQKFFVENGYLECAGNTAYSRYYRMTEKGARNTAITQKLSNAIRISGESYFTYNFTRKAEKEQFCVKKEDRVPKNYTLLLNEKGKSLVDPSWKVGTYAVARRNRILKENFPTREEALRWAQNHAKTEPVSQGKARYTPPQLASVRRTGPDYRHCRPITGQDYLDEFGFRGGEFGNWLNQKDRQASLDMGYDALKDLAEVLGIDDKDISFQGSLSIAFGARGKGNAVAHYEPLRQVINLTKLHGAGSLAHEWWHALDDYLGMKLGASKCLTENKKLYGELPAFQALVDTMKYKMETEEQAKERVKTESERTRKRAGAYLDSVMRSAVGNMDEEQKAAYNILREDYLSGVIAAVQRINALRKQATGHAIPKAERQNLELFARISGSAKDANPIRIETDFSRNSSRMSRTCSRDGGYWDSDTEMTARAFACYIKDRIAPNVSDYLAGHADCALTMVEGKDGKPEVLKAFPEGEERKAINEAFDALFGELKEKEILHKRVEKPKEKPAPQKTDSKGIHLNKDLANGQQVSIFDLDLPGFFDELSCG